MVLNCLIYGGEVLCPPYYKTFGWALNVVFVPTEVSQNYAHAEVQCKTAKCQDLWFGVCLCIK